MFAWLNQYSAAIQAVAALAIGGLTYWLVRINARYARITADAVRLSQEQLDRQQRVYAEFGLLSETGFAEIWIANLGVSSFLVLAVKFRWNGDQKPQSAKINSVVEAGRGSRLSIPEAFFHTAPARSFASVDVALVCVSSGEKRETRWRAFTLYTPKLGRVDNVRAGIRDPWPIKCGSCGSIGTIFMQTEGLENFDQAFERQKRAEEELGKSCPNHKSELILGG